MRLPWHWRSSRAPRRAAKRPRGAGLRVRRLERRRVLAASVTDIFYTPTDVDPGTAIYDANEGTSITATSDARGVGELFYEWTLRQDGTTVAEGFDAAFTFTPPEEGNYEIFLRVVDSTQLPGTAQEKFLVHNVAPTLTGPDGGPVAGDDIDEGQPATIFATIVDPGATDVFELDVDWKDGGSVDTIAGLGMTNASGTVGGTMYEWTAATRMLQLRHVYADDGLSPMSVDTYGVELFVRDTDGGASGPYEVDVVVRNVDPVLSVTSNKTIDEGRELNLSGMDGAPPLGVFTDAGQVDTHTATVDWGDGTVEAATVFSSGGQMRIGGKHVYADDGVYTVQVTVTDDDGGVDSESFLVTVNNVVPLTAITVSSFTHFEGDTFTLSVHFVDPGFDNPNNPNAPVPPNILDPRNESFTYDIDWGDGRDAVVGASVADVNGGPGVRTMGTFGGTHVYADDGVYQVTIRIRDDNNGVNTQSFFVTIKNAAPTLVVPAVNPVTAEGALFSLAGLVTFSDPGFDNPLNPNLPMPPGIVDPKNESFTFDVDWGDGRDPIVGMSVADMNVGTMPSMGTIPASHVYADDGDYTITVTIYDDNGGIDTKSFQVTVENVKPTLTVTPSATTILEGGSVSFEAMFRDPGFDNPANPNAPVLPDIPDPKNESFTYDIDWGDGRDPIVGMSVADMNGGPGMDSTGTFGGMHTYADDGTYTVTVTIRDDNGLSDTKTFEVVVENVKPTLTVMTPPAATIDEGGSVSFTVMFADPGFDNPDNPTTPATGDPFHESFTYDIDWGDGRDPIVGMSVADMNGGPGMDSTGTFGGMHTYADDGIYTITVTIRDDNGLSDTLTFEVLVENVAPSLEVTTWDLMIDEGGSVSFEAVFRDPGFDNPDNTTTPPTGDPFNESFTYFLDWGDGRQQVGNGMLIDIDGGPGVDSMGMFDGMHTYADDGTYTVTIRVADDNMSGDFVNGVADVDFVERTFTVVVNNVRPTLGVTTSGLTINEGDSVSFNAMFTDPGADNPANPNPAVAPDILDPLNESFRYYVDWGDGRDQVPSQFLDGTDLGIGIGSEGAFSGMHTYADDGTYTITIRLADDNMSGDFVNGVADVDFVERTFTVVVNNVAPFLTGTTNLMVNEGQAFTLNDLGVVLEDFGFDNPLNPTTPTLGDPFQETFTAFTINWGDGRGTSEPVSIDNVNDRVSGSPGVTTKATFTHAAFTYADDGVYTVTIRVADDNMSGNFATGVAGVDFVDLTFTITVKNVMPTLNLAIGNQTVHESEDLILPTIGTFTDPGFDNGANPTMPALGDPLNESFRYFLDWGDGREQIGSLAVADTNGAPGVLSTGSFGGMHNYADNGVYTVTIRLADDNMTGNFAGGVSGVDYVEQTFTVTVLNLPPAFVPRSDGSNFQGDEVNTDGITTIRVAFNDPGYDNPLNTLSSTGGETVEMFNAVVQWGDGTVDAIHPYVTGGLYTVTVMMTPAGGATQTFTFANFDSSNPVLTLVSSQEINDPGVVPQLVTYVVNWGDGHVETFQLSLLAPGVPVASNGLTTLLASTRVPGNATTLTNGSAEVQHRYLGPPDPLHPTADIMITLTVFDDDGASVTDFVLVGNPGIETINVAIDTTPDVPPLDLSPPPMTDFLVPVQTAVSQVLQSQDVRGSAGEATSTADRYLELRVVYPDGTEGPGYRIKDEALLDLRAFFRELPDGRYRIYLVRSETKVPRLVIEVDVRRGRVVDVSDESEGTRDRPPTTEEPAETEESLQQNPFLEALPGDDPQSNSDAGDQSEGRERQVALAAVLATAQWSGRVDRALAEADERDWRRLRLAARRGRVARPTAFPRLRAFPGLDYNQV